MFAACGGFGRTYQPPANLAFFPVDQAGESFQIVAAFGADLIANAPDIL